MSYIKQNVQGSYELDANDRNKAYLLALKDFLIGNGFTFVEENYAISGNENIVLQYGNTQYKFKIASNSTISDEEPLHITVSKLLDNGTAKVVSNEEIVSLRNLRTGPLERRAYAIDSTVLLVKNQNSFALVITSATNSITSSNNIVSGNIAYKLLDGTDSDISFVNGASFLTAEKTQGNAVTFRLAHNRLNDDRLVYENKLSVNQSGFFVGESNEIIGLVGAEKGKIYQTEKGKYFALANDMAMLMGDEML